VGVERVREMDERLGLNLHRDGWPTARSVAAHEEAGLRWLQVHVPPRPMLADRGRCRRHARALRSVLHASSLRLVRHAPDDLSVGTSEHDRAFDGMLDYAAEVGAEIVAYHGMNFADAEGPARARIRERAQLEERSFARPPPARAHAWRDRRRAMLLDVGHLHITTDASRTDIAAVAAAVAPEVVLFHLHDNLGVRRPDLDAPPWGRIAGVLRDHSAPLLLEVELSQRPSLPELTAATLRVLASEPQRAAA
jgi:sugar phosphate isomerase/epimerase